MLNKPTLTQIVTGTANELLTDSKNVAIGIGKVVGTLGYTAIKVNSVPYALPYVREIASSIFQYPPEKLRFDNHRQFGEQLNILGVMAGIGGLVGQCVGCGIALATDHQEYLLVPVVTNVASLIYKKVQKVKNNLEEEARRTPSLSSTRNLNTRKQKTNYHGLL